MNFQDLLVNKGVDLSKTKLIRHNISNPDVAENLARGHLDIYQSIQMPNCFGQCDTVISFLGTEGTNGIYKGCYRIVSHSAFDKKELPSDFFIDGHISEDCVFFRMERMDILTEMIDRLEINWGKSTRSWCQNGTTEKEVISIKPPVSEISFVSYDRVILPFRTLQTIVNNHALYKEWENRLSAVAGIYLITDTQTGKHYVGSASGEQGGIWGRWSEYAKTKHGGNKRLMELITADADYCCNFQFSILEVFPIKRDKHEVLEYEQLYKRKLGSIQFGLNDN